MSETKHIDICVIDKKISFRNAEGECFAEFDFQKETCWTLAKKIGNAMLDEALGEYSVYWRDEN